MKILRQRSLFLVSLQDNLDKDIIQPKIPQTLLVQQKHADYKTKRVCFYPSIDSAITALSTTLKGVTLFVYQPVGLHTDSLIKTDITSLPTAPLTGEYWYLAPIQLKKVAEIKILKPLKSLEYTHGPRSTKDYLYKWEWEEILKPWEKKKSKSFSKKGKSYNAQYRTGKSSESPHFTADSDFIKKVNAEVASVNSSRKKIDILTRHIENPDEKNPHNTGYAAGLKAKIENQNKQ